MHEGELADGTRHRTGPLPAGFQQGSDAHSLQLHALVPGSQLSCGFCKLAGRIGEVAICLRDKMGHAQIVFGIEIDNVDGQGILGKANFAVLGSYDGVIGKACIAFLAEKAVIGREKVRWPVQIVDIAFLPMEDILANIFAKNSAGRSMSSELAPVRARLYLGALRAPCPW